MSTTSRRIDRSYLAVAALVAGLSACATDDSARLEQDIPRQDDDLSVAYDLSQAPKLQEAFERPRRYPFTVAVAPLYIEWTDNG
ncbi:hypothetical protein OAX78_03390, partial [Planctomycetota bacterium]|nr:hypothetical protein [Planctomycetota bacterium]